MLIFPRHMNRLAYALALAPHVAFAMAIRTWKLAERLSCRLIKTSLSCREYPSSNGYFGTIAGAPLSMEALSFVYYYA